MRRPTWPRLALVLLALAVTACSDDDAPSAPSSTDRTEVSIAEDPDLVPLVLTAADLPDGFEESSDVNDTVTAFCANEDAAAGLQASGRSLAGYQRRAPTSASAIHLVFRFVEGDAATFVRQATEILGRCSDVPDVQGLAFTYAPAAEGVAATMDGTDASVVRYGVSAGSGALTINLAAFHRGDLGELVAVLGVDTPRDQLDALAVQAFTAAVARLP